MDFDGNSYVMHREPEPGWLVTIRGAGARYCAGLTESGHEIPVEALYLLPSLRKPASDLAADDAARRRRPTNWDRLPAVHGRSLCVRPSCRRHAAPPGVRPSRWLEGVPHQKTVSNTDRPRPSARSRTSSSGWLFRVGRLAGNWWSESPASGSARKTTCAPTVIRRGGA